MAYLPEFLHLVIPAPHKCHQVWHYRDTVTPAALAAAGYLSDAGKHGMRPGDEVCYRQYAIQAVQTPPASPTGASVHVALTVNADTGAVDLSDATVVSVVNT